MRRTSIALGLVGVLGLVGAHSLAGLTIKHAKPGAAPKAKNAATTRTTKPAFVANTQNTPGTLEHFVGAHADVRDTKCVSSAKGWTATVTANNPTTQTMHYRIFVSFLDGDTTVGIAQTDVRAGGGATVDWTATVGANGEGLRCILRVERAGA